MPQFRNEVLAKLTPEEFARHQASLCTNLLEPPKKLVSECHMHWAEVTNETREWRRNRLYADAVEATTLPELIALYDALVLGKESRRKLSVLMHGKKHPMPSSPAVAAEAKETEEEEGIVYLREKDWPAFRASRPLFPCSPLFPTSKY